MAITSCVSKISQSIMQNCDHPLVNGFTGRGILIDLSDNPTFTVSTSNPRIIEDVTFPTSSTAKFIYVDNVWTDAFTGSNTALNSESGRTDYAKTFSFRVPQRGAEVSKNFIEPLQQSTTGFVAILEKQDRVGDGSFEVIGYLKGLKVTADGITRNEYENGGDWVITMSTNEMWAETTYFDTDYNTTLTNFDSLLSNCYD